MEGGEQGGGVVGGSRVTPRPRNTWLRVVEELGLQREREEEVFLSAAPFRDSMGGAVGGGQGGRPESEGAALIAQGRLLRWRAFEEVMGVLISEPPSTFSAPRTGGANIAALVSDPFLTTVAPIAPTSSTVTKDLLKAILSVVASRMPKK